MEARDGSLLPHCSEHIQIAIRSIHPTAIDNSSQAFRLI